MKLYCFHLDIEINIIFLQYYYNSRYLFRWYIPEITTVKQNYHCNKILSTSLYLSYKRVQKKDYKTDYPWKIWDSRMRNEQSK